jgi:hypothetical protein
MRPEAGIFGLRTGCQSGARRRKDERPEEQRDEQEVPEAKAQ